MVTVTEIELIISDFTNLTPDLQRIIKAMIAGEVPEAALEVVFRSLTATDFEIDDVEERPNGDKFLTIWYRQDNKSCPRCGGKGAVYPLEKSPEWNRRCPVCGGISKVSD
jgi:ribosomal protein S27AE